ncbi:cysteine-rich CWC family protein [Pseudomonas benzenivorans]|uniref:Cysteine-rich CWC family protein n=1 Tax=Pseudomonas benzenivorans TaxID=556533 RepID=A0ABZ0Q0G6_9PSED|nr:cysteine-rich CWC family protein [Pseudomonas benzenivorans]WPC06247.1 cysteine-rich CWC family protein [Pseudomonas benzenivorans]
MSPSTSVCPLCGQRNQCAQAGSPTPVQQCWCFDTAVRRDVLERLPAAQRNLACLCPRCAQGLPPVTPTPASAAPD